ncbi:helix-turn-helix domain-containing protein [Streptomyces boluensis]|uniref:Helix-turn-helix domain-containing protein n=1 Tax=Streptomyces boluensis TaxID=1775135 RepID=A0A964XIJ2_9ACTN|nr:pyridoxamine 5'-phosphate oxidase family protein [Streptomyces boluensis]NBE50274.1 helix-turn-helix domain-containing protein [Streptomyces boluensis]
MTPVTDPRHMSDLGRRVAARRTELGLSAEEVAARTGSTPGYIERLEEQLPMPGTAFLVRLANGLETTVQDLMGYVSDLPAGSGRSGVHTWMDEVDEAECWALLSDHGVGRVAVTGRDGPEIFPVNYQVVNGKILMLTAADAPLARAAEAGETIAFEEDCADQAFSQGWSVLVGGPARTVQDRAAAEEFRRSVHSTPWAGGDRDTVVLLTPRRVTGRRVLVEGAPGVPASRP